MSMSSVMRSARWPRVLSCASVVLCFFAIQQGAMSQTPPAPSPAKRAVDERKAIFTLIGANFRPIGEQLQGACVAERCRCAQARGSARGSFRGAVE